MNPSSSDSNSFLASLRLPSHWPMQADLLQWFHDMGPGTATILIMGGIVYLMFGWYMFKGLIVLNAAVVGAFIGARLGDRAGSAVVGALVGALITGAITWPLMKYAVAAMGGVVGVVLGASIWRAAGLEPSLCWAGSLTGLVGFSLLSFIIFRGSVIMYMSLQGSVMLIFGIFGLVYKYQELAPKVTEHMQVQPFLLPLAIFVPALLGLIYQQTQSSQPEGAGKKK